MSVYLIRVGETGPLKIGHGADIRKRLRDLQTAHADPLMVCGTIEGGEQEERGLHRRFAHLRLRGEWFKNAPEIIASFIPCDIRLGLLRPGGDPLVSALGGTGKVASELGLSQSRVSNWRKRGVPWRWRAKLAQLASMRGIVPPQGFLEPGKAA